MRVVHFRQVNGIEPVDEFIGGLLPEIQASLDLQADRLNMLTPKDPPLPFPHSSQVMGALRELRYILRYPLNYLSSAMLKQVGSNVAPQRQRSRSSGDRASVS